SLIQASTCNHDAEKWNCTFPPVNLDLSEDLSFNAYVRLTDRVRNGMPATACTRAFSLQVDDGVPILSSFTTSAGGYYGPGKTVTITADFEDEDAGIDPASVKATFSPLRVGTTVANNVVPTSHSGNTFTWADVKCAANCPAGPVSATVNAKDYAGNAVSDTAQFRMDDDPPDILPSEHDSGVMIDIYSTSDEDREDFAQNEMLHIEVLARDLESGSVWMSSNISKWSGHGNDDNRMVCAAPDDDSISVCSLEKPMRLANDGVLGITIGDALDNTVNITRLLTVYESDDEIRDFVVIDFSGFTYPGGYSLPPIDKFTIMNAPEYHAFVYFHLNHTGVCDTDDMAVLDSSLVGFCADSGVYVGAFYPDLGPEGSFEGFLELVLPKDYIEHNWDVLPYPPEDQLENNPCVLAVSVRCGSTVYATPEEEEIALLFKVALDTDHPAGPTDSKVREIKAIKDKYGSGFQKKLDDLNNLIEQGQRMCYIKQLLAHFGGVIMTIEATLNGLLKSLPGPLKYIVRPLTWTIDKIMQWTGNAAFGTVNTFLTGFCGFVTCEWNVNLFGVIGWEGGSDFMKSAQSFGLSGSVGGDSTLEVAKKSYIASVATLCLPGILYNLHKKRQAECYKAFCYEQQTVMGATFDQCDAQYGYYNCLANAGPFLQSEFAAIWEWINPIDDIIESLTNPVAMGWMGMKYASKRFCFAASEDEKAEAAKKSLQELASALQIQGAFQWISCSVFVLMEITEAVTMVMKMYDTYEQMQHPGQFDKDYCEAIGI
ncbi:MAG: hypothetical protein KJ709_06820, partial [Nanoarchaeota archaeon]|nr:hypothetical protein [Nanoarchaeota archaeon]